VHALLAYTAPRRAVEQLPGTRHTYVVGARVRLESIIWMLPITSLCVMVHGFFPMLGALGIQPFWAKVPKSSPREGKGGPSRASDSASAPSKRTGAQRKGPSDRAERVSRRAAIVSVAAAAATAAWGSWVPPSRFLGRGHARRRRQRARGARRGVPCRRGGGRAGARRGPAAHRRVVVGSCLALVTRGAPHARAAARRCTETRWPGSGTGAVRAGAARATPRCRRRRRRRTNDAQVCAAGGGKASAGRLCDGGDGSGAIAMATHATQDSQQGVLSGAKRKQRTALAPPRT
jgi:hypothetical protein